MSARKHHKSAVALMIVAGGLVAAAPASALAQEDVKPNETPGAEALPPNSIGAQNLSELQCSAIVLRSYEITCNGLYLIDEEGTKTLAADGRYLTGDGTEYIVVDGAIVQQGAAEWHIPNPPRE